MINNTERMAMIAKNVKKLLKERGITQKKLADDLNISQSAVTAWMKLRHAPAFEVIQDLADYFGVEKTDIDAAWKPESEVNSPLINKIIKTSKQLNALRQEKVHDFAKFQLEEQKYDSPENVIRFKQTDDRIEETIDKSIVEDTVYRNYSEGYVEYISDAALSAGEGVTALEDPDVDKIIIPKELGYPDEPHIKPFRVHGRSMEPKYYDGDIVWVDTNHVQIDPNRFGAFYLNGETYIKKMENGWLVSVNPDYDDIKLQNERDEDDLRVIGLVIDRMSKAQFDEILNIKWER